MTPGAVTPATFDDFNTAVQAHQAIKQIINKAMEDDYPAPRLATVVGVLNSVSMTVPIRFYGDDTPVIVSCSAAAAPVTPGMVVRVIGKGNGMLIVEKYGWYPREFDVQVYGDLVRGTAGSWGTIGYASASGSIEVTDRSDPVGLVRWRPDSNPSNSCAMYINPPDGNPIYLTTGQQGELPFDIDSAISSWALYMDFQTAADSMNASGLDYAPAGSIPTTYDVDTDTWSTGRGGVYGFDYVFYLVNTDPFSGSPWVPPSSWALIADVSTGADNILHVNKTLWKGWQPYTSVWSSTGTQPTYGASFLVGRYCMVGEHACAVHICLEIGTGASGGTGTYLFSLPFQSDAHWAHGNYLNGRINPLSSINYTAIGWIPSGASDVRMYAAAASYPLAVVAGGTPALAVGGQIDFWGIYELA